MPTGEQPRVGKGSVGSPLRQLLSFYLPLVLTSQMMTLSNPLINLSLSRAEDPRLHLAAFSVCFGLCVFLNAPALVSRDVGAGLCTSRTRYRSLLLQILLIGLGITVLDLALAFSPLGRWVFEDCLQATPRVAAEAGRVAISLSPIPVLVGVRGLHSALALRARRTRLLTQATFFRLLVVIAVLAILPTMGPIRAANVGWALSLGILLETIWIVVVTGKLLARLPDEDRGAGGSLGIGRMLRFSVPLVISAFTWTALRPVINAILGRCVDSEAAQAGFGVLHPLILLTASGLWALQATGQIMATDRNAARRFLGFGAGMTLLFSGVVVLLGWIPVLRDALLTRVFTLPAPLLGYVEPAMKILFLAPVLLGIRACFKGLILASGRTGVISASAVADLAVVSAAGILTLWVAPGINGAVLGVLLVVAAELTEASILGRSALERFGLGRRTPTNAPPAAAVDQ